MLILLHDLEEKYLSWLQPQHVIIGSFDNLENYLLSSIFRYFFLIKRVNILHFFHYSHLLKKIYTKEVKQIK